MGLALCAVMPGHSRSKNGVASARLCPGIHAFSLPVENVDGRVKPGHDWGGRYYLPLS
jgi:hypothetical protein